jgi:hypothetical protein
MVENHRHKDVKSAHDTGTPLGASDDENSLFVRVAQEGKDAKDKGQKLATGDQLIKVDDGQILVMPDGQKLVFSYANLLSPSDVQMLDKNGDLVDKQYKATITTMPEVTVSNFGNGARLEARPDVGEITFPNGDKVVYDQTGIATVTRGGKTVKLHEPQYEEFQLPGSGNKQRVV